MSYTREQPFYAATLLALQGGSCTVWSTVTLAFDGAIEVNVPFRYEAGSQVSLEAEVRAFRSLDGGASFESMGNPFQRRVIPRNPSSSDRLTMSLPGGVWAVAVCGATPNTGTVAIETCRVITAYVGG